MILPTDERLPPGRLIVLALQRVLVMYAGAVAVPLILGSALKLPREQVAALINADLFACDLATLIQSWGVGLFGILVAPLVGRLLPFFPAVVTGSIITVIGITLMRVGINWAGGGAGARDFGAPGYLGTAALVLAVILALLRWGPGFVQNIAVLLGIVVGYAATLTLGWSSLDGVGAQPWLDAVLPFQFGAPRFGAVACLSMCLVMIVVMIESTGMFLALGDLTGRRLQPSDIARGLRADGLGTLIGGVFNTFPYSSFSQNVGLVGVTGVRSRFVCVAGGIIMLLLGLLPKMAYVVASMPQCVLGGGARASSCSAWRRRRASASSPRWTTRLPGTTCSS